MKTTKDVIMKIFWWRNIARLTHQSKLHLCMIRIAEDMILRGEY